ncbi:MAG: alpha/beta fold hydrolase [Solirubrobacterales bacterium]
MSTAPETRYARSGEYSIAYQVVGDGDRDVLYLPGFASHLDLVWEDPDHARVLERLSSFSRLILIDRLGTGLSDRLPAGEVSTLEQRMDDVEAVMSAAGSERAALLGWSEGAALAALYAASHPERVSSLVMYGGFARILRGGDHPWALDPDFFEQWVEGIHEIWGEEELVYFWAPSMAEDAEVRERFSRYLRSSASPGAAADLFRTVRDLDITRVLPTISVPTLVIHRVDDVLAPIESGRYIGEKIPGAKFVELPGTDHLWWFGDQDAIFDEIEEFLTGARSAPEPDRVLSTVLFTDIVGSTERAAELGDSAWRDLLDGHSSRVRQELERFRGNEIKATGDGFLATFDGPARGVRCAMAITDSVKSLGIEVRAGLHTGEVELLGEDVGGIAVHTGARVSAAASPSEVLVSSTVKDLVAGSGLEFADRGTRELKGVPGEWRLFAAEG